MTEPPTPPGRKCRHCGEQIRRITNEGYDRSEYEWVHEWGGLLCDLGRPFAEPTEE